MSNPHSDPSGYFSALFHHSRINACLQMDVRGVIQCINPAFKHSFGYDDADLEGKHFSILFTDDDRASGRPETEIRNVMDKGQADDKNFLVHKNKTISWVSGESVLVEHETGERSLLKIIQDIHEQKDFELSLGRQTDFNESILKVIDDFVIILSKSMQVIKYNPAFARLFKNQDPGPLGDFALFIKPYDKQDKLVEKIWHVIQTGKPFGKQVAEIATPSGDRVFDMSCQVIATRELEEIVLLIGHDITLQKIAATEREDLMAFVAHELRNPLASIKLGNDLMAAMVSRGKPEDLNILLEKNAKNIERLNKMVAELYNATKLGAGDFVLNLSSFDFDEMIAESVETFRVLHPDFRFKVHGNTHRLVKADVFRLQQVISNYLSNAVKYSDGKPEIDVQIMASPDNITVCVKDCGTGLAEDQLPKLFGRFFRAEKTRKLDGMGLGLYLCRRIVEAHDGTVWAESTEGEGSAFYFSLPQ